MSDQGKNTQTADDGKDESPAVELMNRYEKKDKVVALASDDLDAFVEFVSLIGEGNYTDWTGDIDNNIFTGLAMVRTEAQANRLIPIASMDAVFSDETVKRALYKMYVNRVVNAAADNDAVQSQFITVAGNFKQKYDLDAFKFQARVLTKFLRGKGLLGVTNASLRQAFASDAFAKTQFPRIDGAAWEKIIGIAEAQAAKNGYDTGIFDYWKTTRNVATADMTKIELDFGELSKLEDVLTEEKQESEEHAKA